MDNKNNAAAQTGGEQEKTAPDEGKTFDKNTVFECVTECSQNGIRYRKGDIRVGRKCPPHFEARPDIKPEGTEGTEE
jgi:hypothetical protein